MKKVLVTGANGFIGSHLTSYLIEKGYQVIGIDIENKNNVIAINMENYLDVREMLKNEKPEFVVHAAGSADVSNSFKNAHLDYRSNVTCTHNLLFALKELDLKPRIIFLSSAAIYGNPKSLPISEEAERNPLSPYALHKAMCEDICLYFINNYGFDIKVARIFSAYGNGLRKQIFWDMNTKLKNTNEINLFGTGKETRDYIHIDDVVKSIDLLINTNDNNNVYNIANGQEVSIREVAECFALANRKEISIIKFNNINREGEPLNWRADISRIKKLGYQRSVPLKHGIENYVKWVEEN